MGHISLHLGCRTFVVDALVHILATVTLRASVFVDIAALKI